MSSRAQKEDAIVGMDLGTTNSVVASVNDAGKPTVIANSEGKQTTPSVVGFDETGGVIVGSEAKNSALAYPDRTFSDVKGLRGQVTDDGKPVPAGSVDGKEVLPAEVEAHILRKLKVDAETFLDRDVTKAVISVPAYFGDAARQATRDAGRIAGLEVVRIVNEPTAAAVAYGVRTDKDGTILVHDLGGGTLDVSIIRCSSKCFEVSATGGDRDLGGTDFDNLLCEFVLDAFESEHGFKPDPVSDTAAMQDLKDRVERARISLSTRQKTVISFSARGKQLTLETTREQLEEMIGDLVEQTMDVTQQVLDDSGLKMADIDDVILVGGASRTPMVRRRFVERFGKEPSTAGVEPDLAVAKGCAILAVSPDISETTGSDEGGLSRTVIDVCSHPLGVEAVDPGSGQRTVSVIIPRNSRVPAQEERVYSLEKDLQTKVRIKIVQGEEGTPTDSDECETIGELVLEKLPRKLPREPRISVRFGYTVDGIIEAEAVDLISGISTSGRIENRPGMTDDEIAKAREDVEGTLMA